MDEIVSKQIEENEIVATVTTEIKAAFDLVDHEIDQLKLELIPIFTKPTTTHPSTHPHTQETTYLSCTETLLYWQSSKPEPELCLINIQTRQGKAGHR